MPAPELDPAVPPTAAALVLRLLDLRNVKQGLPISSHRPRLGPAIVRTKSTFRRAFQPLINELLHKQSLFNEASIAVVEAVYRDLQSLEGGTLAMRAGIDARLRGIEDRLARIEERLAGLDGPGRKADAHPTDVERN
jgi:hypothetical protein